MKNKNEMLEEQIKELKIELGESQSTINDTNLQLEKIIEYIDTNSLHPSYIEYFEAMIIVAGIIAGVLAVVASVLVAYSIYKLITQKKEIQRMISHTLKVMVKDEEPRIKRILSTVDDILLQQQTVSQPNKDIQKIPVTVIKQPAKGTTNGQ